MTWSNIPDSAIDPDQPVRSVDIKAIRDNIEAQANGDSGAPKQKTVSMQPPESGTDNVILYLQEIEINASPSTNPVSDNSFLPTGHHRFFSIEGHIGFTCLVPGVVTVGFQHYATSGTSSNIRILKNEIEIHNVTTSSGSYVQRFLDVDIDIGDIVILQNRVTSSPGSSFWRRLRVYSGVKTMAVA